MMRDLGINDTTSHVVPAQDPCIDLWFTSPDLGHPLVDDNYYNPPQLLA